MVFWNASHGWASFAKQAAHGIKDKPENALLSILELIGGQAGLASPIVFGFCLFGAGFCLVRGYRRSDQRLLLLGATTVPVFAFFLIHAASQKIQPNWPGFVYPAALLAAVHGFLALGEERRAPRPWRLAFSCAPWLGVAFTLAAFLQLGFGLFPLPEKKDPTARLKGWSTLASEVAKVQREAGARFVLTEGYAITGELAFYSPSPENVMQINERIRYAFLPEPDEAALRGAAAVLVVHQGSGPAQAALSYAEVRLAGTVARGAANRAKDKDNYDVYVMTGYRGGLFADDGTRQGG